MISSQCNGKSFFLKYFSCLGIAVRSIPISEVKVYHYYLTLEAWHINRTDNNNIFSAFFALFAEVLDTFQRPPIADDEMSGSKIC